MNEYSSIVTKETSFKDFLLNNKRNRVILCLAVIAAVVQFFVFKYFYPFASYIHGDSFSYLNAANDNLSINTYLIGYSKFLRFFSVFAKPDYMLVAFQYLFIQFGILFLLFTIFYFYRIGKAIQVILLSFMVFNPLFLHLANMISSDGFFLALSCIWFSLLLWIIHKPSNKIIIWHALILFIAFTVRYNAMIYPVFAIIAFGLSNLSLKRKIAGIGLVIFLCGWFVGFTMFQYKRLTGHWQYSPFSGWQLANNAMYTYRYVDRSQRKPVPKKFQVLDNMIREYFDSTRDHKKFPAEEWKASTVYMWTPSLSLYKYRNQLFKKDTSATELKRWASMGPFYKEYGTYIIKKYPLHFLQHYVWPNANKYYAPPVEFLENYNGGRPGVPKIVVTWFGYNSQIKSKFKNNKVWVLDFYPILSGIINVSMLCFLIFYLTLKGWSYQNKFNCGLFMGSLFWLANAGFTIFASSAALRFQSFPIILTIIFVTLLIDWMLQIMRNLEKEKSEQTEVRRNMDKELATHATI